MIKQSEMEAQESLDSTTHTVRPRLSSFQRMTDRCCRGTHETGFIKCSLDVRDCAKGSAVDVGL